MSLYSCQLIVSNCTFVKNRASNAGGGIFASGSFPPLSLTNCKFYGNTAERIGGGICNASDYSGLNVHMAQCLFSGNSANAGGGFFNWTGDWTLINCTFSMNESRYGYCGAGIYNVYGNLS